MIIFQNILFQKHTDENITEKELDISGYENVLEATANDRSNASPVETKVNIPLKSQQQRTNSANAKNH